MNVAGSALFKDFARPILQYGNVHGLPYSPPSTMDSIIQYLLNRSKLEVTRVRISNPTEKTFTIGIECRVNGTGPVSSTISPMELDLMFNGDAFGKLKLPQVRTSFWGTKVVVEAQTIEIKNQLAYLMFMRSIFVDDETSFELENGECSITAMKITAHCNYCLGIPLRGMGGPQISLKKLSRTGWDVAATFEFVNPSPVEIDHGRCVFELRYGEEQRGVALLQGDFKLVQGKFILDLDGLVKNWAVPSSKARLVGISAVGGQSWANESIKFIDSVFDLGSDFAKVLTAE
ncbi:Fc.00g014690.m01.CDS01 [Cosmosporella sp. VM-42]